MSRKLKSYLRTCRLRSGLNQKDIAFLLSLKSASTVSRLEKSERQPSFHILLCYCIIFRVSPAELVPGIVHDIENTVVIRAKSLQGRLLKEKPTPAVQARIGYLDSLIAEDSPRAAEQYVGQNQQRGKTQTGFSD